VGSTHESGTDGFSVQSADGTEVFVRSFGGKGPPLVICHATGFHGAAYTPVSRQLTNDFAVWAIDVRGHGRSPSPASGDFSWNLIAQDVTAGIAAVTSEPVVAFGHSLGGAALLLAELNQPGLLRAAYLYEPIVFPPDLLIDRTDNPMSSRARNRRSTFSSRAAVAWRYAQKPPFARFRTDALVAYVEEGFVDNDDATVSLACKPEDEAKAFECEDKVTIDLIQGLTLPALIASGHPEDGPNPARLAPSVVEAMPNATLRVYPQLGHLGPFESPDFVGEEVRDFLVEH